MKLIVAQGNPGKDYVETRHNVGFIVVSAIVETLDGTWKETSKWNVLTSEVSIDDEKVMFVLPQTFYNETGRSVRQLVDFYKLDASNDLLVIHDDLALPFGLIRIRQKGSDAGNNGIKSINAAIGEEYARIRIGIWNELRDRMDDAAFVLNRLTKKERALIDTEITKKTNEIIHQFIHNDLNSTSHRM